MGNDEGKKVINIDIKNIKYKIDKRELKKGYIIHKQDTKVLVCRILNEYDTEEEAKSDLVKLLTHGKTENDLLKEFTKKETY